MVAFDLNAIYMQKKIVRSSWDFNQFLSLFRCLPFRDNNVSAMVVSVQTIVIS